MKGEAEGSDLVFTLLMHSKTVAGRVSGVRGGMGETSGLQFHLYKHSCQGCSLHTPAHKALLGALSQQLPLLASTNL